jgi:hypothetical protein
MTPKETFLVRLPGIPVHLPGLNPLVFFSQFIQRRCFFVLIPTRLGLAILAAALMVVPAFATRAHQAGTSARGTSRARGKAARESAKSHKLHGQQAIAPERVTEIQQALIKEHYLSAPANGEWDSTTVNAMQKYQSDQGWQTKLMPDSRALKKLGLGADYSNAINAKGSSFAAPAPVSTIPTDQTAGFTAASGVRQ